MDQREFVERSISGTLPDLHTKCVGCGNPITEHSNGILYVKGIESRGVIRIVKTSQGEGPVEIRDQWVGLEIPAACLDSRSKVAYGVVSGKPLEPAPYYVVSQRVALEALKKKSPSAALWWRAAGFPLPEREKQFFGFHLDEVEEVEPVSPRLIS